MVYSIAHFTDVHLAPLPFSEVMQDLALKRLIGGVSWHRYRKKLHVREVADALRAHMLAARPDHVCFTGDLVNICTAGEMRRGLEWLQQCGAPDYVTLVPGNHDAYVKRIPNNGFSQWGAFFDGAGKTSPFPFVRLRKNIAIIGVSTAIPQPLHKACGKMGEKQIAELSTALRHYGAGGFYRVVLIHHPPLPGQSHRMRELEDAHELQSALMSCGAELVLHGHNHRHMHEVHETSYGPMHVFGLPSASMATGKSYDAAAWAMFDIERRTGHWHTRAEVFGLSGKDLSFSSMKQFEFVSGSKTHAEHS